MLKRVAGALALTAGIALTAVFAVKLAYAIPSNFTTQGEGLDMLVDLVERYSLRGFVLAILTGLALCLTALPLWLSPRKRRVAVAVPKTESETGTAEASVAGSEPVEEADGEAPPVERVSCVLRTRLMGSTFRNRDGGSRRALLKGMTAGDILLCRSGELADSFELIGVYTLRGDQVGYLDRGFVRDLRSQYPGFRIGITVERMIGGTEPHTCLLRVAVYAD